MKATIEKVITLQNQVIELQDEIIEKQKNNQLEVKRKLQTSLDEFNNIPSMEELYQQQMTKKVKDQKERVEKYKNYITNHGMVDFTIKLVNASSDFLVPFQEFTHFCDSNIKNDI